MSHMSSYRDDLFMGEGRFGMQVGNGNAARGFDLQYFD